MELDWGTIRPNNFFNNLKFFHPLNSLKGIFEMHLYLLILLTFFQSSRTIEWNQERKLTWEDFKGKPEINSTKAALTYSSIHAQFGYNDKALQYTITCTFDGMKSWGRIKNDYILAHEQGHFDLTEVFARKLNKNLSEYRFNKKTVGDDINKIYQSVVDELTSVQQKYDRETDHSRDFPLQAQWNRTIDSLLTVTHNFRNYKKPVTK